MKHAEAASYTFNLLNAKHFKLLEQAGISLKEFKKDENISLESIEDLSIEEEPTVSLMEELIFPFICLYMFPSDEDTSPNCNNILLQQLIPQINRLTEQSPDYLKLFPSIWRLLTEGYKNGGERGAITLLVRFLKVFLPWKDESTPNQKQFELLSLDIRQEDMLKIMLSTSLLSKDSFSRKQALYILKQSIRFSTLNLENPSLDDYIFGGWSPLKREKWAESWKQFFLLFESFQETQLHLLEPLKPLLMHVITSEDFILGSEWWQMLIKRAIMGDSASVRKWVLECYLETVNYTLESEVFDDDFNMEYLMKAIDNSSYYHTHIEDGNTKVSPFGLKVAKFYSKILFKDEVNPELILKFITNIDRLITSATPALFLLQSLLTRTDSCSPSPVFDKTSLSSLSKLARNNSIFHNLKARNLARWQLFNIVIDFTDPSKVSFNDIVMAIHEITKDSRSLLSIDGKEFHRLNSWLTQNYSESYIFGSIEIAIQRYLSNDSTFDEENCLSIEKDALIISTMLSLTLSKEGTGFAKAIKPLYQQFAIFSMIGVENNNNPLFIKSILLFTTVNEMLIDISSGLFHLFSNFNVTEGLYQWISYGIDLLLPTGQEMEYLPLCSVQIVLKGIGLFMRNAMKDSPNLITYLDMLLYRLADQINSFSTHPPQTESIENYQLQLNKYTTLELLSISFEILEQLNTFHLGFSNVRVVENILKCSLRRPPSLTDQQIDSWEDLIVSFSISKWSLLSIIARFTHRDATIGSQLCPINKLFVACLDALETARFRAVIAIVDCLSVIAGLDQPANIPESLIDKSFRLFTVILEEADSSPTWYYLYIDSFIEYFVQEAILGRSDLTDLSHEILDYLIRTAGATRKNVVPKLAQKLAAFWRHPAGKQSRMEFLNFYEELVIYGPVREENEDRLASSLIRSNKAGQSEGDQSVNIDYLVRVSMNSVLLTADPADRDDRLFALQVVDDLLSSVLPNSQ